MILKYSYLLLLMFVCSSVYSLSLKIDKMRVNETGKPGSVVQGVINVINDSRNPLQIFAGLQDFDYASERQQVIFKPMGTQKDSCSRWIQIMPRQIQIPPNTTAPVQYVITIPSEGLQYGEYYSAIYIETLPSEPDLTQGFVIKSRARMAVTVRLRIDGIFTPKGKIEEVNIVPPDEDNPLEIVYSFYNTGNVMQKVTGQFSIIDAAGNLFGRGSLSRGICKGGEKMKISSLWEGELNPGEYDLITELQYEPEVSDIQEIHFEIK